MEFQDVLRKRSAFDMSHDVKFSGDMGYIIPMFVQDVLPGDTWINDDRVLIRFTPLKTPIMHDVHARLYYYFVPDRLCNDNWEEYITGGETGVTAETYSYIGVTNASTGTLWDYFGLPTGVANEINVLAAPFRAYALIKNEHHRNQNFETPLTVSKASGDDVTTNTTLQRILWPDDYFTMALDALQRGTEATLTGDVTIDNTGDQLTVGVYDAASWKYADVDADNQTLETHDSATPGDDVVLKGQAYDDISLIGEIDGIPLSELREAVAGQRFREINMRSGARYVEVIKGQFGVISSDARLQRPEFLGADQVPVIISEVLQQSKTDGTDYLGTLGGHGYGAKFCNGTFDQREGAHLVNKTFEEHGWIIGLIALVPNTVYSQGVERKWSRTSRYSYAWPIYCGLSEQAILKKEIYAQGTAADEETWAYTPRFEEYRRAFSKFSGDFRDTFDHWHMGRQFGALPALDDSFVLCTPREDCFQAPAAHTFFCHIRHDCVAIRKLTKQGTPGALSLGI